MKITVTNLTQTALSTDIGLVNPMSSKSVTGMDPSQCHKMAFELKALSDAGRASVLVQDDSDRLNSLEMNPFCSADVTVSSAELLALNATPKTLVAAPGAGQALIFESAIMFLSYAGTAYAGIAAGEDLSVKYTDGSGAAVAGCETTGFLDATADATRFVRATAAASGVSQITPVANAPLVLQLLSGEITTGNSPLKLRVFYRVVPMAL